MGVKTIKGKCEKYGPPKCLEWTVNKTKFCTQYKDEKKCVEYKPEKKCTKFEKKCVKEAEVCVDKKE